ncbi:hypothetical protein O3G_MSEX009368 [Manduca sexta]|uniref:Nicotinamide-nucleotide adenylyltransferase n=1 Tax=Manduca sexta TaxID=7130 RepID=A0A921ZF78_MANSE|nr:hypothetical protein O3G_MSEX009368 [Manduca sexta]
MLKLALRSSGWIKISEWETQRSGWTRTRVSLQYHQDMINSHMNALEPDPPSWLPDDVLNVNSIDEPDSFAGVNGNQDQPVTIKLLCGADLLESFATPGLWSDDDLETIVGHHGLVVVTRAGSDPGRFIHESDLLYKHRKNIMLVTNYIANEVSSTVIRRLVRRGESAKYLTDDAVLAYLRAHRLYGAAPAPPAPPTSVPVPTTHATRATDSPVTSNGDTSQHCHSVSLNTTTSHQYPSIPPLSTSQHISSVTPLDNMSQHCATVPSLSSISQNYPAVPPLSATSQEHSQVAPLSTYSRHYPPIPSLGTSTQHCPPVPPLNTTSQCPSPIPSLNTASDYHLMPSRNNRTVD